MPPSLGRCEADAVAARVRGQRFPNRPHRCQNDAKETAPSGLRLCGVHARQYRRQGWNGYPVPPA